MSYDDTLDDLHFPLLTSDDDDSSIVHGPELKTEPVLEISEADIEEAMVLLRADSASKKLRAERAPRKRAEVAFQYGRQSKKETGYGQSPERQAETCEAVRIAHGLPEFQRKFFDKGMRGVFWAERRELMELIRLLERSENYGASLVVEDVDRLLRDDRVLYRIGPILLENDIQLYNRAGRVDTADLVEHAARAIASYKLICGRSLEARRLSMETGRIHGAIPYGYEYAGRGKARPNANAEHVLTAFRMRASGDATGTIARLFQDLKVPAPGVNKWTAAKVLKILKRPFYVGVLEYKIKGEAEPLRVDVPGLAIVDRVLFDKVQAVNALASLPEGKHASISKGERAPLLLSGRVTCGNGVAMHAKYQRSDGSRLLACCQRVGKGTCACRPVKFDYGKTERNTLMFLKRLLDGVVYEQHFRKHLEDTDKARSLAVEERRLADTRDLMRERTLYEENRAVAYQTRTILEMEPEFAAARKRIAVLEARISASVPKVFADFLKDDLLTLRETMDELLACVPFPIENPDDEQVRRVVQAIVTSVQLTAPTQSRRLQVTTVDFGAAIGQAGDPSLVFHDTVEYDETPELLLLENRDRIRWLVSSKRALLTKVEYDRLVAEPVVRAEFGDVFQSQFKKFFGILLMAAELDLPLTTTIELAGLERSVYAASFKALRKKHVALQQLIDVITALRGPVQSFFGRIMLKSGPYARMEAVSHPLLEHPLCRKGGSAMSDDEWAVVRPSLKSLLGSKHAAQCLGTARMDIDFMLDAVRRRLPMAKVCPANVAANAMRRINKLQSMGDFERMTWALLEHANKRAHPGRYPVPLF